MQIIYSAFFLYLIFVVLFYHLPDETWQIYTNLNEGTIILCLLFYSPVLSVITINLDLYMNIYKVVKISNTLNRLEGCSTPHLTANSVLICVLPSDL